jgi:carotenoid 1,2-hydratase
LAIYGPSAGDSRWVLSEYREGLERSPDGLSLHVDDVEPWTQRRVSGQIRIEAAWRVAPAIDLASNGQHHWYPVAPASRASVEFERPDLRFEGVAYHDMNQGERALEDDFVEWDWSRLTPKGAGHERGRISYDVVTREVPDAHHRRAFGFGPDGLVALDTTGTELPVEGKGFWGVHRKPVVDEGASATHLRALEDSPFYTRSVIETQLGGEPYVGVHEALRMDRFVAPLTQAMLPFRIRRR